MLSELIDTTSQVGYWTWGNLSCAFSHSQVSYYDAEKSGL
jgi:hypothetical protein